MMVLGSAFGINADAAKTFPEICGEKQAKIQEKISRKREKFYWFSAVFMEKTAKKGTFFEVFQEILMAIKAVIKHTSFSTNPSVSRKNLKKVPKKVLT